MTVGRRASTALAVVAVAVGAHVSTAEAARPTTAVRVDASHRLESVNRRLVGFNWTPGAGHAVAPLSPAFVRLDASLQEVSSGPGAPLQLQPLLQQVAAVRATGAEPLVILSYTPAWMGAPYANGRDPTRVPPSDLDAWEAMVHDVVRALATAPAPARRFEAWNEPDIPIFWQDTPAAWVDTVARSARAVARVQRETGLRLFFGGPATVGPDPVYLAAFLTRFRDRALPLDFVSWHYYGNYPFLGPDGREPFVPAFLDPAYTVAGRPNPVASPAAFGQQVGAVRQWTAAGLAGSGRPMPALVLDEWNLSAAAFDRRHDSNDGAAFDAAVLIELQQAGLDASTFFRAADGYVPAHAGDWGVTTLTHERKPAWWSFWLWQRLADRRLAVTGASAEDGLWAMATSSRGRLTVLLASFSASNPHARLVDLTLDGLGRAVTAATVRRVDASHVSATKTESAPVRHGRVRVVLPPQAVALVSL